mmetsp:Transcript_39522/g.63227  ORF Transcript_39522/g.63227 Transcript_39522/m.63227 type:complete len:197 (+) Transcript_39522:49-639(+)
MLRRVTSLSRRSVSHSLCNDINKVCKRSIGGFEEAQKAHRARLEMMQQERFVDPNAKVKRFHMRALWTPMLMKYWIPCLIVTIGMIAVSDNLTLKKRQEKTKYLQSQGYGDPNQVIPGTGGMTMSQRNRFMEEHINRVIHGEDGFEVAKELQLRFKEEQEMKQRLQRQNPASTPMSQSPNLLEKQMQQTSTSKLRR